MRTNPIALPYTQEIENYQGEAKGFARKLVTEVRIKKEYNRENRNNKIWGEQRLI
ncbi:MAG: hypothetical protein ACOX8P_05095 [Tepidanaerobacteraceae bacterium]